MNAIVLLSRTTRAGAARERPLAACGTGIARGRRPRARRAGLRAGWGELG